MAKVRLVGKKKECRFEEWGEFHGFMTTRTAPASRFLKGELAADQDSKSPGIGVVFQIG